MSQHADRARLSRPSEREPASAPRGKSDSPGPPAVAGNTAGESRQEAPQESSQRAPRQPAWLRAVAFSLAILPLTLLAVASRLQPNSAGLGTHQQLGLPPCSMRVMMGIRCPSCGMTTSWAHFMHGQWVSSFQVNAGGFLLAGFSLAFAWIAMRTGWSGQFPSLATQRACAVAIMVIAAVTLVDWTFRLLTS